jgi:glycosyltransferase involved in cell wall biosynthesis
MKRILILEPYFGGSHKHFLEGLQRYVTADYLLFTLPARKWKMRMQLSAPWFAEQIKTLPISERHFDSVLCSTFVDVAVLRSLLIGVDGWNHDARVLTYFHENQFVYPQRFDQPIQHHFTSINFHSALASDGIAFNSDYNKDSFLTGCGRKLKAASDMKFPGIIEELSNKSRILFPGIEFSEIDKIEWKTSTNIPVIVWNHRWEHDKNPEIFFLALDLLEQRGVDFRLIILGQSFTNSPDCFAQAEEKFKDKILHYGFASSHQEYIELLCKGDIVVSTSLHEFYGIAIIEAVRAGCYPILPNRLSYPELFDKKFLYNDDDSLPKRLVTVIKDQCRLTQKTAKAMTDKFSWLRMQEHYSEWL